MTGKRIGAVLVAVALIAGAVLLRTNVLDDDEPTDSTNTTTPTTEVATAAGEVICITELDAVCRALGDQLRTCACRSRTPGRRSTPWRRSPTTRPDRCG